MLNKLYQKTLKLAAHKRSNTFLAILSFTESSFFPIPPDVMIAPMVIAKKNDYLKIFLIATLFSSLGGILGYFIGSYFFDLGMIVVEFYIISYHQQMELGIWLPYHLYLILYLLRLFFYSL